MVFLWGGQVYAGKMPAPRVLLITLGWMHHYGLGYFDFSVFFIPSKSMGKLTDSLKASTRKLQDIKQGIHQMQQLGQELGDNTFKVAEAALKAGYAYAQAEAELAAGEMVVEVKCLPESPFWTVANLKERFKTCNAAYQHLKLEYGVTLKSRSWQAIADAFNQVQTQTQNKNDRSSLEQRVIQLETLVQSQQQQIASLERQLQQSHQKMEQMMALLRELLPH